MVGEIYDPRYQMSVSDRWDPEVRRRMGSWGGVDRYGLPRNPSALMPDHELGPHVQFAADVARIRRNRRLEDDAFGAQQGALGLLESYRPGGAAAMASGVHSRMSDILLASRTDETPDYLFRYREHKAHEAQKAARRASQLKAVGTIAGIAASFINPALGAGIMAATQAASGSEDAGSYDANTQQFYEQSGMPPPPKSAYDPNQGQQGQPDIPTPPLSVGGDGMGGQGAPPPGAPPKGPQNRPPQGGGGGIQQGPPGGGGFMPQEGGMGGAGAGAGTPPGGPGAPPRGPQGGSGAGPGGAGGAGAGGAAMAGGAGTAFAPMAQEIFQEVYRSEFAFDPYWDGVVASLDQLTASIVAMVA